MFNSKMRLAVCLFSIFVFFRHTCAESYRSPYYNGYGARYSSHGTPEEPSCICLEEITDAAGVLRSPTAFQSPRDGSDRIFIGDQTGYVWVFNRNRDKTWIRKTTPFLNLTSIIEDGANFSDEQGLLSMTFHPKVAKNSLVYIYYALEIGGQHYARLSELKLLHGDRDRVDVSSERIILLLEKQGPHHNGGDLLWDKDGLLYLTTGDDVLNEFLPPNQTTENAQDLSIPWGKILRIDVDTRCGDEPYSIPFDNPFVDDPGARGEIYAYGFRNPWRCSYDEKTDRIFLADNGQFTMDELDIIGPGDYGKGGNYGWPAYEATVCFKTSLCGIVGPTMAPVYAYEHIDRGGSIIGGYVYRGKEMPGFVGMYFYGDWMGGFIARLKETEGEWAVKHLQICDDCSTRNPRWTSAYGPFIQSFGLDEQGELYFVSRAGITDGRAYKIIDPFNYQQGHRGIYKYN